MASHDKHQEEFEELSAFLGFFFERYMAKAPIPPGVHPLNFLREMMERSPKRALQGLRMAINDCIEMSNPWTATEVAAADRALRDRNLLTLSELRRRYSKKFERLLKRAKISNEVEYYMVKAIVSDGRPLNDETVLLEKLIAVYEAETN